MTASAPGLGRSALTPTVLIVLYALSILLANITLNKFIQLPVFGLLSVGTIFFAAVFTLRDRIHRAGACPPCSSPLPSRSRSTRWRRCCSGRRCALSGRRFWRFWWASWPIRAYTSA
ncbi:hypothetical protein MSS93_09110 [Deinococcus radiodurans]|nr:hypothetical protein MSS93_09110 [Deinococcus radiodurans]